MKFHVSIKYSSFIIIPLIFLLLNISTLISATYNPVYYKYSNNNNNNIDLFRYGIENDNNNNNNGYLETNDNNNNNNNNIFADNSFQLVDNNNNNNNIVINGDDDDDQQILALEEEEDNNLASIKNAKGRRNKYLISNDNNDDDNEIYILEDKDYPKSLFENHQNVGQVSGITTLPSGDVVIFYRSNDREWNDKTFNENFTLNLTTTTTTTNNNNLSSSSSQPADNLIKNDTIMIINGDDGSSMATFGSNLFYMPHSIASDSDGNLWISDVARHQVMRLPTSTMIQNLLNNNNYEEKKKKEKNSTLNLIINRKIWPDIILGESFVPGSDNLHFCQPSELKISSDNRLLFIADGYCNQRVMVFTTAGKFITSFGEELNMNVVHSLTLIEDKNLICVADRENSKIYCFKAGLDGNLNDIGKLVLNINYPLGRVFAIQALNSNHLLVSSNQINTNKYDLATLNPFASTLKQTWASSDLSAPHSLAKTNDNSYFYAADISKEAFKKVFKFNIIERLR